jgi:23S rRNA pseudouridine1911/1915/1917 synthase
MRLRVSEEDAGARLDAFLAGPLGSRARAARAIAEGRVRVDGQAAAKSHAVRAGELIEVAEAEQDADEEAPPAPFSVVYEDEHLLVVDKPAGVVVHPGRGRPTGTLAQALAGLAAGGDPERPGIVHRLDRETSGLLVVARSDAVHEALREQIRKRAVRREYLALVIGRPESRTGTIDAAIGRDRHARTRVSTETDEPRHARTHFELERALPEASLLRVTLETGRTHQIRVHLAAIGLPVAGDPEYGVPAYGLERQFLHAARLVFTHPVTGKTVDVSSPLPEDLQTALERASTNVR